VTDVASSPAAGRLNILLEEYRALRSEVNQRIGASATLVGFVAAGAAFVTSSNVSKLSWVAVAIVGFLVLIVWASNLSMLGRLGKRLHRLETLINEAAREAYGLSPDDPLLAWDSYLARSGGWMRALAVRLRLYDPSPAR
jgi:hypothetical protein